MSCGYSVAVIVPSEIAGRNGKPLRLEYSFPIASARRQFQDIADARRIDDNIFTNPDLPDVTGIEIDPAAITDAGVVRLDGQNDLISGHLTDGESDHTSA